MHLQAPALHSLTYCAVLSLIGACTTLCNHSLLLGVWQQSGGFLGVEVLKELRIQNLQELLISTDAFDSI